MLVPHILREDGARYISSGRMSPLTTSCSYTTLVLVTIYPQGGWARYTSSGRMSSRTTSCSSITLVLVTTYPQGGWARYISSGRMSSRTIHCSLLPWCFPPHILGEDELFTYPYGDHFHYTLREDELSTYPRWGWAWVLNFGSLYFMLAVSTISSWRMSSLHIHSENELYIILLP